MDDFIRREAAIETLSEFYHHKSEIQHIALRESLNRVPTADVRPVVSGEWERPKGSTSRSWIFVCSKCGDRAYFPVPKYFPKGCGYKFCPNCGADMTKTEKEEKQ